MYGNDLYFVFALLFILCWMGILGVIFSEENVRRIAYRYNRWQREKRWKKRWERK